MCFKSPQYFDVFPEVEEVLLLVNILEKLNCHFLYLIEKEAIVPHESPKQKGLKGLEFIFLHPAWLVNHKHSWMDRKKAGLGPLCLT